MLYQLPKKRFLCCSSSLKETKTQLAIFLSIKSRGSNICFPNSPDVPHMLHDYFTVKAMPLQNHHQRYQQVNQSIPLNKQASEFMIGIQHLHTYKLLILNVDSL
ncbi:hypothetical protein LXL04_003395 [Taraxacum kok-saghyz]